MSFITDLRRMGANDQVIQAVCCEYGGNRVYIDNQTTLDRQTRKKEVIALWTGGTNIKTISKITNYSVRWIYTIIKDHNKR